MYSLRVPVVSRPISRPGAGDSESSPAVTPLGRRASEPQPVRRAARRTPGTEARATKAHAAEAGPRRRGPAPEDDSRRLDS